MVPYSSSSPWMASTGQSMPGRIVAADVPAVETRVEPDVGPAVERLARVAMVLAEPLGRSVVLEALRRLFDGLQADRLDEDVRRHRRDRLHRMPAPAWISAMEAPSEWPIRIGFSMFKLLEDLRKGSRRFVVHEAHGALAAPARTSDCAVAVAVVTRLGSRWPRRLRREVAPLADRAEAFVQEHQRRPARPLADPFVVERAAGRLHRGHEANLARGR